MIRETSDGRDLSERFDREPVPRVFPEFEIFVTRHCAPSSQELLQGRPVGSDFNFKIGGQHGESG